MIFLFYFLGNYNKTPTERVVSIIVYAILFIVSGIVLYRIKNKQEKLYKVNSKTKRIISNEL